MQIYFPIVVLKINFEDLSNVITEVGYFIFGSTAKIHGVHNVNGESES